MQGSKTDLTIRSTIVCGMLALELGQELAADIQFRDNLLIATTVFPLQIVQQPATRIDHLDESKTGAVVFHVRLEMLREHLDALGKHCHLDIRRTRIAFVLLELLLYLFLVYLAHNPD